MSCPKVPALGAPCFQSVLLLYQEEEDQEEDYLVQTYNNNNHRLIFRSTPLLGAIHSDRPSVVGDNNEIRLQISPTHSSGGDSPRLFNAPAPLVSCNYVSDSFPVARRRRTRRRHRRSETEAQQRREILSNDNGVNNPRIGSPRRWAGWTDQNNCDSLAAPLNPFRHCSGGSGRSRTTTSWTNMKCCRPSNLVVLYAVCLLLSSVLNSVFFKKMTDSMMNHAWFLNIITSSVYIPVFGGIVIFSDSLGLLGESNISFAKYKFLIMGCLDSLCGLLMFIGAAFTSGTAQVLLQQTTLPLTLALSYVLLAKRFHIFQYVGAAVVLLGVLASNITIPFPYIFRSIQTTLKTDIFIFNILFLSASLPAALSQVYKEVAFKNAELDVNYMQFWVAVFQVISGFVLAPLQSLWILGDERVPISSIPSSIKNGITCLFLRRDAVVEDCGLPGLRPCDTFCTHAWIVVSTYLFFNILYNFFTLLVVKHAGATVGYIISTLRIPLSTFAFYSPMVMGGNAQQPRFSDFVGLTVLISGMVLYRLGGTYKKRQKHESPSLRGVSTGDGIGHCSDGNFCGSSLSTSSVSSTNMYEWEGSPRSHGAKSSDKLDLMTSCGSHASSAHRLMSSSYLSLTNADGGRCRKCVSKSYQNLLGPLEDYWHNSMGDVSMYTGWCHYIDPLDDQPTRHRKNSRLRHCSTSHFYTDDEGVGSDDLSFKGMDDHHHLILNLD